MISAPALRRARLSPAATAAKTPPRRVLDDYAGGWLDIHRRGGVLEDWRSPGDIATYLLPSRTLKRGDPPF
jgi:hypothetical protein